LAIGSRIGTVEIVDIRKGLCFKLGEHAGKVNCLAANAQSLVSGGSDTITRIWDLADLKARPHQIPSFRGEILCTAISDGFHMVVSGVSDGTVMIAQTMTGTVTRVIELENKAKPVRVLITNEWGFILVYATAIVDGNIERSLFLFSVNGEFIRSAKLPTEIAAWVTFESSDGFDYVAMADIRGRIFKFEAFYLDVPVESLVDVVEVDDRVDSLFYSKRNGLIVIVSKKGSVRFKSIG
jgi:WD40 repeat protein